MSDFLSLLPPNATGFERAMEEAAARMAEVPVRVRDYWSADAIPDNLMPWLGWEWSVDSWDPSWDTSTRRNVLRDAFRYHQHKGTRQSVVEAIQSLGSNIAIQEWWEYSTPTEPYTFDAVIDTGSGSSSGVLQYQLIEAIDNASPVRCHYTLSVASNGLGAVNLYGYSRVARFQRWYFEDV